MNTDNIGDLQNESDRMRERLHALEASLAAVTLLSTAVSELRDEMPNLARRAAREAVAEAARRQHSDFLANWRVILGTLTFGVSLGGLIVALVLR